jgi:outer membrane protein
VRPRILWLSLLAVCALALPAQAQNVRIGFIDSQRIFNEYKSAQEAQDRFAREIQSWRTEADDRRRQVDELRNELKDQDPLLTEAKRLEKESALQKAVSDYDRFVQDFWGPGGKVQRLNDEITREVIGKVRDAVELLANREGYDLVLDAADGNVIFGIKSLDLTQRVLDDLNKSTVGGTSP